MIFGVSISNSDTIQIKLKAIPEHVYRKVKNVMYRFAQSLEKHFKNNILNGTGSNGTLRSRSGRLRRETHYYFKDTGKTISAGITFDTPYAFRHVKLGNYTSTVIRPVRAKRLAIPFPGNSQVLTPAKQINRLGYGSSYTPIREKFPKLFRIRNTLFKKNRDGTLTPYYTLKKTVRVKVRVYPDRIMKEKKQEVVQQIAKTCDDYFRNESGLNKSRKR